MAFFWDTLINHPNEIQKSLANDMNLNYGFSSPLWYPAILVYHCPRGEERVGDKPV